MIDSVKLVVLLILSVALAACGGGSHTGGGTANSPFVGTYTGSTTITVSTAEGSRSVSEKISIFVHRDGLVQFGDADSTIYASGPLKDDAVDIDGDASALVDPECRGTISIAGNFSDPDSADAEFQGTWSSNSTSCFGVEGVVSGPISATRVSTLARASRVFETFNPALLRIFVEATN